MMKTQPRKSRRLRRQSNILPFVFLPYELITNILSWLTVKNLMQLKCVCKTWTTLICDPSFVKLHLNRSAQNPHFSLVSYETPTEKEDYSFIPFPITQLLQNRYIALCKDPYYRLDDKDCREVVGSCNGLVCLLGYFIEENDSMDLWFRFWNPATRKISDKLGYLHDVDYNLNIWRFVFCYDNSTDTYKVVALHHKVGISRKPEVSIFSLGYNIWRTIQTFPFELPRFLSDYRRLYEGVQFCCTVNWLGPDRSHNFDNQQHLVFSLDLRTETYTQLIPPRGAEKSVNSSNICVLMNSFCFSHDFNRSHFVIWKMAEFGDDKSWTQFLKFSYRNLQLNYLIRFHPLNLNLKPLHLSENGDTMVFVNTLQDRAILYNLRNNRVIKSKVNRKIRWFSIKNYVESLVSTC